MLAAFITVTVTQQLLDEVAAALADISDDLYRIAGQLHSQWRHR